MITTCANKWLTKSGWDDVAYLDKGHTELWIMSAYSALHSDGTSNQPEAIRYGFWLDAPADSIEALAEMVPLKKRSIGILALHGS